MIPSSCLYLFFPVLGLLSVYTSSAAPTAKVDSLKYQLSIAASGTQRVEILNKLSGSLDCKQSGQRLKYINEALSLAEKLNYTEGLIVADYNAGTYFKNCTKNFPMAITWYKKCVSLAKDSSSVEMKARAYNDMATCYEKMAEYGKALACYKQLLSLEVGKDQKIQALGNSGVAYQSMGDYFNALYNYQEAYNLLNKDIVAVNNPTIQDTITLMALKYQIANIYISIPDYERAEESYREIQALNEQIAYPAFIILANMGIGDCCWNKKLFRKAIQYYKNAEWTLLNNNAENYKEEYLSQIYRKLGETYLGMSKTDSAYFYTDKSLMIALGRNNNPGIPSQLPRSYTTMGKVYNALKKYDIAADYLKKAITLSKITAAIDIENDALLTLSKTYEKMGRVTEALHTYQKHITLRDSIHSRQKLQEMTRIEMQGYFDRQQFSDSMKAAEEKRFVGFQLQRQRMMTYSGFGAIGLLLVLSFFIFRSYQQQKKANIVITHAKDSISKEKQVSENLLLNILPGEVAEELKEKGSVDARQFDNVTVLFTDFVDFTLAGEKLSPQELVAELDTCFKAFDEIIDKYQIEKIKTVGDAYLAVSGLPLANENHATDTVAAAIEICAFIKTRKEALGDRAFNVRIGINSGSVVAGIVGKRKFAYDIWSDTVNIAARMEQSGASGKINISEYTYELVKDKFACAFRGEIPAKNKGNMKMYFVEA